MALDYILRRFSQDTGVNCYPSASTNTDDIQYAIDLLNEGAKDWWKSRDLKGSLMECVLVCLDNKQISLPPFVGELRALRELDSFIPWRLSDIRPRYFKNSWADDAIRNWREKFDSPIARDIVNTAPPQIVVPFVENPPIQVTIVGSTNQAVRISETQIITNTVTKFNTSFITYLIVKKNRKNMCDVLVQDADGQDLSVIYNCEKESWWKVIDAGQYFSNPQPFPVEILYKVKFYEFYADNLNTSIPDLTCEFQLPSYDDALVAVMKSRFEARKNNTQTAAAFMADANKLSDNTSGDKMKGKDTRIEFQQTGHDQIFQGMRGFNTLR